MASPKPFTPSSIATVTKLSLANNTDFSYPIRIDDSLCWPKQLLTCILSQSTKNATLLLGLTGVENTYRGQAHDDKLIQCCELLYTPNSTPYQSIDGSNLILFGITLPAFFLLFRIVFWYVFSFRIVPPAMWNSFNYKFWCFCIFESMLALVYASTYQTIVMEYIKASVGAPRPIYHALNIWASVGYGRSGWETESHRSFPSGHSATISSGMGIVMLLLLKDAHLLQSYAPAIAKVLAHLSLLPFAIIVHVGISRIRDYWHFPIDVAVGWAIGALSALFSFVYLSGETSKIFRYLINEHIDRQTDIHV